MQFTRIPPHYAPLGGELIYTLEHSTPCNPDILIVSLDEGVAPFGAKRFTGITKATFDAAPCLRRAVHFTPTSGGTGFYAPTGRFVTAAMEVRNAPSSAPGNAPLIGAAPARTFLPTLKPYAIPALLTALPLVRLIGGQECDEITMLTPADCTVTVTAEGAGDGTAQSFRITSAGIHLLRLDMREFPGAERVTVDAGVCGKVQYTVIAPPRDAVRIAWRSEAGSIEQYTFPTELTAEIAASKQRAYGSEGTIVTAAQSEQRRLLRSAYETQEMLTTLSGILTSPQVWITEGDRYTPVDVLTEHAVVRRHGAMSSLEIEVRPIRKTRSAWN